jgi:hypothetical protein
MTPAEQKVKQLYRDAYMRWCNELSHDKNVLTAKNIVEYICDQALDEHKFDDSEYASRRYKFWEEVKNNIKELRHDQLFSITLK